MDPDLGLAEATHADVLVMGSFVVSCDTRASLMLSRDQPSLMESDAGRSASSSDLHSSLMESDAGRSASSSDLHSLANLTGALTWASGRECGAMSCWQVFDNVQPCHFQRAAIVVEADVLDWHMSGCQNQGARSLGMPTSLSGPPHERLLLIPSEHDGCLLLLQRCTWPASLMCSTGKQKSAVVV